jgi:hypothetical protein
MTRQNQICPYCKRPIQVERFGIRLSPLKAALLDQIRSSGDIGISNAELLAADCYRERRPVSPTTIKAHVAQINDMLAATCWRNRSDRRRWYLCREAP